MEDELHSTLLIEHGGGQWPNKLWITRILLERLSRERTLLGKAVEVFVKLQRRDIIRSMVKIHDLVDLAEPPWRNMSKASTSDWSREDAMDLKLRWQTERSVLRSHQPTPAKQIWVSAKLVLCLSSELCFYDVFVV